MIPYYLYSQPELPIIEEEQEACESVFAALQELKKILAPSAQPDIEDHGAVKALGERLAELSLNVCDGLPKCLEYERNTYYPRVVLVPTWARVHDLFCQFTVDWSTKYTIYTKNYNKGKKTQRNIRGENKLQNSYVKLTDDSRAVLNKMYDEDIYEICETVLPYLYDAGKQMYYAQKYNSLIGEYNSIVHKAVDAAISILAYGIQCFMGMLIRLEKISESLGTLNHRGDSSLMRQYERYKDKSGEDVFFELLRSFDPNAHKNNLPHITKNAWKKNSDKKLAELMGTSVGRECIVVLKDDKCEFPNDELERALRTCACSMEEFNAFIKLFYQYKISRAAYLSMKKWEIKDTEKISALEFYDRIKKRFGEDASCVNKSANKKKRKVKITSDTYSYKWLATEEYRIGRLFQMLQNNAHWIGSKESPEDFYALFKGEPKEFHIKWSGTKQHLYHLFKIIFKRSLVTWGRKNGQWTILASHFKDEKGHSFTSFNGEKESIKARVTIEKLVDILDPSVVENYDA